MFATNASFKKSSNLESGTVNAGQTRDKYENSDSERSSPVMMLTYYALDITSLIVVLIVLIPRNAIQRWEVDTTWGLGLPSSEPVPRLETNLLTKTETTQQQ